MRRIRKNQRNTSRMMGSKLLSKLMKNLSLSSYFTLPW